MVSEYQKCNSSKFSPIIYLNLKIRQKNVSETIWFSFSLFVQTKLKLKYYLLSIVLYITALNFPLVYKTTKSDKFLMNISKNFPHLIKPAGIFTQNFCTCISNLRL